MNRFKLSKKIRHHTFPDLKKKSGGGAIPDFRELEGAKEQAKPRVKKED